MNIVSRLRPSFELPSDHASITCCLDLPRPPLIEVNSKHRRVRNIDLDCFVKDQSRLQVVNNRLSKVKGLSTLPTHVSELELANRFGTFFTDKIRALWSELDKMSPKSLLISYQEQPSSCTLSKFEAASLQGVKKSIMAAPSKSCSLDPLPTSLLKKGIDVLLRCTTSIINRSLELGKFPGTLKRGLVTRLLKKSDHAHEFLKNYRPISNLSFLW